MHVTRFRLKSAARLMRNFAPSAEETSAKGGKGLKGEKGTKGEKGLKGEKGTKGVKGLKGLKGGIGKCRTWGGLAA